MDPQVAAQATSSPGSEYVRRFEAPTRLAHWSLGILFLLLLITGLTNFVPSLKGVHLGGFRLFAWAHVVLGFALLGVALATLLALLRSRSLRADTLRLSEASMDDYLWFQHQVLSATGQASVPPAAGKFNAGQKANAYLSAGGTALLLVTGTVLGVHYVDKRWLGADFVASVFPYHTLLAFAMVPLVLGHLYLALLHSSTREALRGMTRGVVRADWARRHHPAWRPEDDVS